METRETETTARWWPGREILRNFTWADLPSELMAALVVTLVLIPSAIAYADLAHCPPMAGLYASIGGMLVFALFTSSRHVIAGPDAALALMVGATVSALAGSDPSQALAISTWLALLTGALLLVAAWLRLGVAADFLAQPVMLGFMNGAAVVIIISQLGKLCGFPLKQDNSLLRVYEWCSKLPDTHWLTLAIGLGFIGVLVVMKRWLPRYPGAVVVFVVALAAGQFIDFPAQNISVIGKVDSRLPDPVPPALSVEDLATLMVSAVGLAFLIFPEGIVLGRSVASRRGYAINPDRELVALGMANLAAGLLRSFAVGASQTRTLLNDATGGRSQMVSLLATGLLVAFLVFFANWIASLPTVAIAAILIFTGFTLVDVAGIQRLKRMKRIDAMVALLTSIGVVALGVLPGIMVGVFLSVGRLLVQLARPHDALLGRVEGSPVFHDIGDDDAARTVPGLILYRFYGPLIFSNVRYFVERIEHFLAKEDQPLRHVILDARAIPEIDITAAEELDRFIATLRERGIGFTIAKAHLPLRESAAALGLNQWLSDLAYTDHFENTVAAIDRRIQNHPGAK